MKFSQEFIEKVQEATNLVDIISQYTQLKSTGGGLMGRCPFPDHKEKTPSFSVSENKQVYHCFGCHKSGNIFTFLSHYQGMSFPQAVEYLADRAGIEIPKTQDDTAQAEQSIKRKNILKLNRIATDFYQSNLERSEGAKNYLKTRGLSLETVKTFRLGLSLSEWDGLVKTIKSHSGSLELAEEAKLIKRKAKESGYYDLFRERLMFPISNSMGEILAFGGRILGAGEPKYLNSPESPVFFKGRVFYGIEQTARYIRSEDQVIIVEGYMDLISLFQAGIKNAVATMGTALTSDHAKVIQRLTKNVLVLFDGDRAGRDAAERSLGILLAQGLYPKGLILPNNQDPDDYVRLNGVVDLKQKIDQSPDLMSLIFREWLVGFNGQPSEKMQLAQKLRSVLLTIPDPYYRKLYIEQLAPLLGVNVNWLANVVMSLSEIKRQVNSEDSARIQNRIVPSKIMPKKIEDSIRFQVKTALPVEKVLLSFLIKSRANWNFFVEGRYESFLLSDGVKELVNEIDHHCRQTPERFDRLSSLLISQIDDPAVLFPNSVAMEAEWNLKNNKTTSEEEGDQTVHVDEAKQERDQKMFLDILKRVKENYLKNKLKQISSQLKAGATPETVREFQELQEEIKSLK